MKRDIVKLRFLFLHTFLSVSFLSAQNWYDPQGEVRSQLTSLIQARYGSDFQFLGFTIFDSLIYHSSIDNEKITDPYGTLHDCILFSTYKDNGDSLPNTYTVGMLKNGQIIWDNAPGTNADLGGDLLYAQDMNNDGNVDLLFSEVDQKILLSGGNSLLYYLYVLSWNGTSGTFINKFDGNGKSAMLSEDACNLVDKNGDNIQEIKATLPDVDVDWGEYQTSNFPYITYGWNGSQYGFWSGIDQISGDEFLPANRINATVMCSLQKTSNVYNYYYTIRSDTSSRQNISDIYIGGLEDTSSNLAPALWQSGSSSYIGGRAFIKYEPGTYYLIHPGQTLGGFQTITPVLPTIVRYYIQGYTPPIFVSDEEERQNILNNSVSGFTLGTRDTAQYFVPLNFLDTLISYTTQSRTLGWITTQPIADKYFHYFDTAKTQLQLNNTDGTKATLQQVLTDINTDSSSTLTSEAYALLRFNTEYLISQISNAPSDTLTVPAQYSTIQAAVNAATAGKTILVASGTYNESISISSKDSITLLTTTNASIQGVTISNSSVVTVKGFVVNASGTNNDGINISGTTSGITIEANEIKNSSKNGIVLGANSNNTRFFNNVIANNQLDGISVATNSTGTQYIVNNTIVNNGKVGVESVAPQKIYFVNNIIVYQAVSGKSGVRLVKGASNSTISSRNNMVVTNQSGLLQSDYRLPAASRAKDKGTTSFSPLPSKDKDGNPRTVGSSIDLGAYEIQ